MAPASWPVVLVTCALRAGDTVSKVAGTFSLPHQSILSDDSALQPASLGFCLFHLPSLSPRPSPSPSPSSSPSELSRLPNLVFHRSNVLSLSQPFGRIGSLNFVTLPLPVNVVAGSITCIITCSSSMAKCSSQSTEYASQKMPRMIENRTPGEMFGSKLSERRKRMCLWPLQPKNARLRSEPLHPAKLQGWPLIRSLKKMTDHLH